MRLMSLVALVGFSTGFGFAVDSPNPDLWKKIDRVNEAVRKLKKPAADAVLAEAIKEATRLLEDPAFDEDYQAIRADAFAKDFKKADALSARAKPTFDIGFDGDTDRYQIRFDLFKSLAGSGSETADFLQAYASYPKVLFSLDPEWSTRCLLPFDISADAPGTMPPLKKREAVISEWSARGKRWRQPFYREFAIKAAECLKEKKSH